MLCVLLPCACDVKLTWCCVCIVVPTGCPKINRLAIDRFRFGLQWCLAKAIDLGLDIAITPHLDDGLEYGGWRNALWFDPLQKYGGFSYYEASVLQSARWHILRACGLRMCGRPCRCCPALLPLCTGDAEANCAGPERRH